MELGETEKKEGENDKKVKMKGELGWMKKYKK